VRTLINQYGWETHPETELTWRIDDGTSAFYNYIYYTIGGFTENDAFRSNQIREGLMSRDEAFRRVIIENQPRLSGLDWYFHRIGLNRDLVLNTIDNVPKRYNGQPYQLEGVN
jgi:glucosamine--fructose-6-phosphate aminotransferase (isomerizing)